MIKSTLLAAALAIGMVSSASAVSLVANGSFEKTDDRIGLNGDALDTLVGQSGNNSWDIYKSLPGVWNSVSGDGIEVQTSKTIPLAPKDGDHYVELDSNNNSAMEQVINFATSGLYRLSFWFSPRTADASTNGLEYSISGGILAAQEVIGAGDGGGVGVWTKITKLFMVASPDSYNLRFAAIQNSDSYGTFLDDVSIVSEVPLPPTAILLGSAFVGAAFLRRRQSAKTA